MKRKKRELPDILVKYEIDFERLVEFMDTKDVRSLRNSKGISNNIKKVERVVLYVEKKIKDSI